jgi:hypothetical protein
MKGIETVVLVVSLLLVSVFDVGDWAFGGSVVKFASDCAARDVRPWRASAPAHTSPNRAFVISLAQLSPPPGIHIHAMA